MRPIVIADDYTIINTQGIRFVEKLDGNKYGMNTSEYSLRVTYRKEVLSYYYKSSELRDAQYDRIRKIMEEEYGNDKRQEFC